MATPRWDPVENQDLEIREHHIESRIESDHQLSDTERDI
jgi:hypothetical protein